MKIAFVFPGQGSQYVGMCKDLLDAYPQGREILDAASEACQLAVERLAFEGPMEELTRTVNLQPILTAMDMLCCAALRSRGVEPDAVAGHSLGEYPALWAAGFTGLADTFRLVRARGSLMEEAASANPGGMAAIIGLDRPALEALVEEVKAKAGGEGVLALANHNSREQIVVTGHKDLVSALCKAVKEAGKRAVPLKVSGAYHSPLMKQAADGFSKVLGEVEFKDAPIPLYSNVTAAPETEGARVRGLMAEQICSPVRWFDIVNRAYDDGVRVFVELGPKKVLSGLIRKCLDADDYEVLNVEDAQGLDAAAARLAG